MNLTQDRLKELLHYDPDTGLFTRMKTVSGNSKKGTFAGRINAHGYVQISVDYTRHSGHRLAWLYVYGEFPPGDLDHINRDRSCNQIANLRLCTRSGNNQNQGFSLKNTSGFKGVTWHKGLQKWQAQIQINHKNMHLGVFGEISDAASVRRAAESKYHPFSFGASKP